MCSWLKWTKQSEPKTVQGLIMWLILSRFTPKLVDSKISNLQIDRVYPKRKTHLFKCDQSLFMNHIIFHAYILTIDILYSCGGLLSSKGVSKKWRIVTLPKGCDLYEKLCFFLKGCDCLGGFAFSKGLWTFLKGCLIYKEMQLLPFDVYK